MIVVNTSNEISTDISARFRLADGLLRQYITARVSINKLTLTYVSSLIVPYSDLFDRRQQHLVFRAERILHYRAR